MTEPNSTNPSDENTQAEKPRMKLSLRPKSEPAAEPEETAAEVEPTPAPAPQPKVKLKLAKTASPAPMEEAVKETELTPVEEPAPESAAEPAEEAEQEPLMADQAPVEPITEEDAVEEESIEPVQAETEPLPKAPEVQAPTPPATKGRRGILKLLLIAAVMMLALLGLAYWLLTVLVQPGETEPQAEINPQPIQEAEPVAEVVPEQPAEAPPQPVAEILPEPPAVAEPEPPVAVPEPVASTGTPAMDGAANAFVESIKSSDLLVTLQPLGVFIGQVWFAEGATIDPESGLRISAVNASEAPSITVSAADGSFWQIPAKR